MHWNLGRALETLERPEEALPYLREAARLRPADAEPEYHAGLVLLRLGRPAEALPHLERSVELDAKNAEAQNDLGVALMQTGKLAEARRRFEKAVALNPGLAKAQLNLGNAVYLSGAITEALAHWREALRLDKDNVAALTQVSWALATNPDGAARSGAEAIGLALRAVDLSKGRDAAALDALAAAYAESRRFPDAVATARRARDAAAEQNRQALASAIGLRLELYQRGEAFRTAQMTR